MIAVFDASMAIMSRKRNDMKNRYKCIIVFAVISITVSAYASHTNLSPDRVTPANPFHNPYDAISSPNRLEIFKGDDKICTIQNEGYTIEQWGFIDEGNHIVVRFKNSDGQIIMELVKTIPCKCVDIMNESESQNKAVLWKDSLR